MKLKAQDLRIGNLVSGIFEVEKVLEIHQSFVNTDGRKYTPLQEIKPIPITEEWLLKLGFERGENPHFITYKRGEIELLDNIGQFFRVYYSKTHLMDIKYIHELQNLFYCITGNELEMKE